MRKYTAALAIIGVVFVAATAVILFLINKNNQNTQAVPPVQEQIQPQSFMSCNECHSKNPSLVTMHEIVQGEDCFKCHDPDEDLMSRDPSGGQMETVKRRWSNESICESCHNPDGSIKEDKDLDKSGIQISGGLFCPICRVQVEKDADSCGYCDGVIEKKGDIYTCSACGELVDIDKIAALSQSEPSNEICIACHPIDQSLFAGHEGLSETIIENCLFCHESHYRCDGCHR